jgi:hypothetical protein
MLTCRVRKPIKASGQAAVRHEEVEMPITPLHSFADVRQFLTQVVADSRSRPSRTRSMPAVPS